MPTKAEIRDRLGGLTDRDRHRLGSRLARARGEGEVAAVAGALAAAEAVMRARIAAVPPVSYPEDLPVSAMRSTIMAALRDHQVVVVAGETGSGKTTQLPKMCLEVGRGRRGMIGHTQPRRIAARAVAERLADELGVTLGEAVGYAVRFDDRVTEATLVKVMTDGLLLAEIARDRQLWAYDTVIVDEAHERSLNIDFLLGYLTQLLPQRPDLKVVITSATIDTARFAAHFAAPVVEVSGRTYPVEVRYRPISPPQRQPQGAIDPSSQVDEGDEAGGDQNQAICDAVAQLAREGPGDILVFLAGERDIRDAADALRSATKAPTTAREPPSIEILPLYARLSAAEQHRVFRPHRGRRVILATNVAETSLTVPGIRYVVDTGTARVSRYSHRTKVQRLPIEPISRASADQRAGRCGRIGPGVCVRLWSEQDHAARPDYSDPEILRTNLASVILQMTSIGLGDIADFPFVEPPDRRSVADGMALLDELGATAVRAAGGITLTETGRRLAELPLDPRLARMVVEAEAQACLREVVVIASALSIQDPRERPAGAAAAAGEAHRRFDVAGSDFLCFVRLWDYLAERQAAMSASQFRRLCRAEYLSVVRIREWQDLVGQIRQVHRSRGVRPNIEPAPADAVHRALLAGLLSQMGRRDRSRRDYEGARNTRWQIGRGSSLAADPPAWAMAASLVETERTWARTVARIEPVWAERLGAHLVRRSWTDPWWDPDRAQAMADEQVTLYGLVIVAGRRIGYGRVDPAGARDMFIDRALVAGEWPGAPGFVERTRERIAEIRRLEDRVRRRGLVADAAAVFDFYDQRIPSEVTGGRSFERWWRSARDRDPGLLDVPYRVLLDPAAGPIDVRGWPDLWVHVDLQFPLRYRFAPGEPDDGVTVVVALAVLNRLSVDAFDWHVPGARAELVATLVRTLPKAQRRQLGPAGDVARVIVDSVGPADGPLLAVVAGALSRQSGHEIAPETWSMADLPDHLRVSVEVVDASGRVVGRGKDVGSLRAELGDQVRAAVAAVAPELSRRGMRTWALGDLPGRVVRGGVVGYPTLVDEGVAVAVSVVDTRSAQGDNMWRGTRRLLLLTTPLPSAHVQRRLPNDSKLALARGPWPVADVLADCAAAAVDEVITAHGGPSYTAAGFATMVAATAAPGSGVADRVVSLATVVAGVLAAAARVEERAAALEATDRTGSLEPAITDVRRQLDGLIHPGFVASTGTGRLGDLLRYLDAAARRLDRLPADARRDALRMARIAGVQSRYDRLADQVVDGTAPGAVRAGLAGVRWMLEELRVSLWAEVLGTAAPVSEQRISRALDAMTGVRPQE